MTKNIKPLYDQIRPKSLEEFIGQAHIQKTIKTILKAKNPPNILFYGPPGCGKTTLATICARHFTKEYIHLSAPETSVSEIKKHIDGIKILILDEIHRFSKTQQDLFLPLLEKGKIVLLATTTENPSFSITRQLLSRIHVIKLNPLSKEELSQILHRALKHLHIELPDDIAFFLVEISGGDARSLLNLLEFIQHVDPKDRSLEKIKKIIPKKVISGDRRGDNHYHLASAFIKSIRGSDPDAAIYYLACMLESGEDPRFICRRLILSASEDVGLADPYALTLAVSCAKAVEMIGMPEGFIPMAETTIYLSLAPKSNSSYRAYLEAKKEIENNGIQEVPIHLRNPVTKLDREQNYGKGYKYPHDYPNSWVQQQYLPETLKNKKFYFSKKQGKEPNLGVWIKKKKNSS